MSPGYAADPIEREMQAILDAEQQERLAHVRQQATEKIEAEQQAQERAAALALCKERLVALAATEPEIEPILDAVRAANEAALNAQMRFNTALHAIRDDVAALGAGLPEPVDLGSYDNGYGLTIGDVMVRRQRPQTTMARLLRPLLQQCFPRGPISLDNPKD